MPIGNTTIYYNRVVPAWCNRVRYYISRDNPILAVCRYGECICNLLSYIMWSRRFLRKGVYLYGIYYASYRPLIIVFVYIHFHTFPVERYRTILQHHRTAKGNYMYYILCCIFRTPLMFWEYITNTSPNFIL